MPAPGSTLEEAHAASGSPLVIGQIVAGKYRIERQIGRGGMGIVLAATHLQLEHLVAIKVMRRDLLEDERALDRLLFEARSAARIRSEHVARVLDVGTLDSGSPFIVMEYLEGEDLADLLDRQGALEVEQAVTFMLQSCEALAEVHVAEMVHRDLKPGNLFIARLPDGSPTLKILDFGISKHIGGPTRDGATTTSPQVLGSPFYMAPEQMRADVVDERSDIWALGAILFEMLTARPPFMGETLPEVYAAVLNSSPPPVESLRPGVPPGLDDVVQRCLEKDPAQRFCDVADLAEALAPFGGLSSGQSVERITRILTNPEPLRARYSSIPALIGVSDATLSEDAAGSGVKAVRPGRDAVGVPALRASGSAGAEAPGVGRRASLNPAEHLLLPATGTGKGAGASELRPRSVAPWIGLAIAASVAIFIGWTQRKEPRGDNGQRRAGTASSVDVSGSPVTLPAPATQTGAAPAVVSVETVATGGDATVSAAIRTEKSALRPGAARSRPSISVEGFRAAVVASKKKSSDDSGGNLAESSARPRQEAAGKIADRAPAAAPAPSAAVRAEMPTGDDPWDPNSFGERR